jgi:hypothetical protein
VGGSVWGTVKGSAGIPKELVGTIHTRARSAVRVTIDELVDRTMAVID